MKRLVLPFTLFLCLLTTTCSEQPKLVPERVDKAAADRVAVGMYPVVVIGMVDGDRSAVTVYGKLADGNAPDADTVFEIGSTTKTFTATLLADAVLSGRVKLDTPVSQLLPDFTIPDRNGKQITLADIATQHSGLPRMPDNFEPADPLNPYADYDADRMKAFLAGYGLKRDPGAAYEYSNLAVGLLGYALAQSAHMTYSDLVKEKIFTPLGMTMSGIAFTDAMRAHLAPPTSQEGNPVKNWDLAALAGAGGIRSTAADMLRYLRANMRVVQTPLAAAMKMAQEPRQDMDRSNQIGLIWMTRSNPGEGGSVIWHNGMTGGYASFIGFTPDGRHGVVVLTNISASVDDLGFAALLPNAKLAPARKAITLPVATLDQYVGVYKLTDKMQFKVNRAGDQLVGQATGQGPVELFASASDAFFARVGDFTIDFTRDGGDVTGLIMHYRGDHPAPKLTAADLPGEPKSITLDPAMLNAYIGRFTLPGAVFDVTSANGQLAVQLIGQPSFPVYPSAKDKFFYKVVDAQIDFERDPSGAVIALVLHQNGRDMRAPRVVP